MKVITLLIFIIFNTVSFAQPYSLDVPINHDYEERAASCTPPTGSSYLELNNVKALIHTGGNMWQIAGQNFCHYEIPKGSGKMVLFTSALWLGGVDINGQLKLAALRYRNGQDYWTGPLTTDGTADISTDECNKYDQHYRITKDEVKLFNDWFSLGVQDAVDGTNFQQENYSDYQIPQSILNWPAHGDVSLGQDYYLAPFYDRDENGVYNPEDGGDYPWYDLNKEIDCRNSRTVTLFGDETLWWVMNDKGNIHTESGGDPIGMEIRSQAFAFATSNEINNSTFYNYELFNRSTQTLYNTYFGLMVDVALGGPNDDYVGCDVSRGLGYAYNGDDFDGDEMGFSGYGENPPAVGVDFFEGPYQDNDNFDNPIISDYVIAKAQKGIPYKGLGIGYGDGVIDNERFGMRKFLYYNNTGIGNPDQTDPTNAQDYYGYLSGYWKDGTRFAYGGNGHSSHSDAGVEADFMFPGDTDTLGWGTGGQQQANWTEQTSNNLPYDRRFAQSAGPFTLKPGAVNNITVGVVWARAKSGGAFQSVIELQKADDKAQALFDNCFEVLEGPHAPNLSIQEMENELIISIYNPTNSNNSTENYEERDPEIVNSSDLPNFDYSYNFQGYQVFQLLNDEVSVENLYDVNLARLVFQTDLKDSVSKLVNYEMDFEIGAIQPTLKVNGNDEGIRHSFSIKEDLFALGNRKLVNHKTYYYMAISYAYNNFKTYIPTNPDNLNGQNKPYLASRKAAIGGIKSYSGIPHSPAPENGGTSFMVNYGYELPITQLDGIGNGGNWVEYSTDTEKEILRNNHSNTPTYTSGNGPIEIKVIDPLNLMDSDYKLFFTSDINNSLDEAGWYIVNFTTSDTVFSDRNTSIFNEQLIPEWGISVIIIQIEYAKKSILPNSVFTTPIGAKMSYSDSSKMWLSTISDNDQQFPTNWIRSGTDAFDPSIETCLASLGYRNPCYYSDIDNSFDNNDNKVINNDDPNQYYEQLLGGGVAPFRLVGHEAYGMPVGSPNHNYTDEYQNNGIWNIKTTKKQANFVQLHDVDIVLTSNKDNWTRCVIFEINDNESQTNGNKDVMEIKYRNSVDKNGVSEASSTGRGWFPGYAVDLITGQRLNMAFSENSWLTGENGDDMIWNPTSKFVDNVGNPIFGGMHYIYVFGASNQMPEYDKGDYIYNTLNLNPVNVDYNTIFKNCQWVIEPILLENHTVLESDVRISLRVNKPYAKSENTGENNKLPAYGFSTKGLSTQINDNFSSIEALSIINIVPNPYYAYSQYEDSRIDNKVKFTNLPQQCTITIFNMNGQLVRRLTKDNELTSQDWNLKNHVGIPISGGMYIMHVEVPEVGEKILKWFGTMRTIDLDNF